MDGSKRRTRFEERVRGEREFLAPVNARAGARASLAGMTGAAIASWRERARAAGLYLDVKCVAAILREAAARAELLADNSRDVLEADPRGGPDGLAALRRMLDEALAG